MKKILICGCGHIGTKVYDKLISGGYDARDILLYDKYDNVHNTYPSEKMDYVFICVPTDMKEDGSADTSAVDEVLDYIKKYNLAFNIIIKSTVPLGYMEGVYAKFKDGFIPKEAWTTICYSPEFTGCTLYSEQVGDFVILSRPSERRNTYLDDIVDLYYTVSNNSLRIKFTDYNTASLAKYMENSYLAAKVSFCAQFYNIAKAADVSYPELRELFVSDERLGESHTFIFKDHPYYKSHCLDKDVPAIISKCKEMKVDVSLLESIIDYNEKCKEK